MNIFLAQAEERIKLMGCEGGREKGLTISLFAGSRSQQEVSVSIVSEAAQQEEKKNKNKKNRNLLGEKLY